MTKSLTSLGLMIYLFTRAWVGTAQDGFPVITAENIQHLQPVVSYDFADLAEMMNIQVESGIFITDPAASQVIVFGNVPDEAPLSTAVFLSEVQVPWRTIYVGDNQYDRVISDDLLYLGIAHPTGADVYFVDSGTLEFSLETETPVLGLWFSENLAICGETAEIPESPAQVVCSDNRPSVPLFDGQASDFARIGRVPPPLAVTVNMEGQVTLWDIEQNEILVQVESGGIPIVGSLNADGRYLAWRDPESANLFLLDFETGENKVVAPLSGEYITHLKLSHGGDVIIGIDPQSADGQIWAWLTETGEKLELGPFRDCNRSPDLAQFSADGTALVIGCDFGIEVWRINGG